MPATKLFLSVATLLTAMPLSAQVGDADGFLEFPIATEVSASDSSVVAWLVAQGDQSHLMYARAPEFKPVKLFSQSDHEGLPITSVFAAPKGDYVAY